MLADSIGLLFTVILAIALFPLGYLVSAVRAARTQSELRHQLSLHEAQQHGLQTQLSHLQEQFNTQREAAQRWSDECSELRTEKARLESTLSGKEEHFKQQLTHLQEAKDSLKQEFQILAQQIFEEKSKSFTAANEQGIKSVLEPLKEKLDGFQKRVNEIHDASIKSQTEITQQMADVMKVGLRMSEEATDLSRALKGNSQQRGAWGESQLLRTLEMSGLIEGEHFSQQDSFKDESGKGKRTDFVIRLPDKKHIIIDSKVSLVDYERAVNADTPEQSKLAMEQHIQSVRKHILDLEEKDYSSLLDIESPNFVLMFMPIESAYIEALKFDTGLFEFGYRKNIVLVSHTTLIPILRTVSNLWMIEHSNTEARNIADTAGEIFNTVCLLAERLGRLGASLHTVANHYNDTVTSVVGRQGIYGKVQGFQRISSVVKREFKGLEPLHLDVASERLQMLAEPIPEPAEQDLDESHNEDSNHQSE
jgi:DNA recombination protein RmuC